MIYLEKVLNDRIEELKKENYETLDNFKIKLNQDRLDCTFDIEDCYTLEDIENHSYEMMRLEEAFVFYDHYVIEDENIVFHGKLIKSDIDHNVVVVNTSGKVLAVYGPNGQGYLKSIRGLF